jgi:hypothetical protein
VIAEHVAELQRDAAANRRAEAGGADGNRRLGQPFELQLRRVVFHVVGGRRGGRRQAEARVVQQRGDLTRPAIERRQLARVRIGRPAQILGGHETFR